MARWILCGAAVGFLHIVAGGPPAAARLIAFEDFEYGPTGSDLHGKGSAGAGFAGAWSGQTSYNIGNGSLSSPVNPLPSTGSSISAVAFGENRGIDRLFSTPVGAEGSSLYVSVLMQPIGILHQGAYGGWFSVALRPDNGDAFLSIGMNYSKGAYGIRLADIYATSNVPAEVGKTVFLVARVDYTEGVDPVHLYVNPQPGAPEPTTPTVSLIDYDVQIFKQLSITGPGGSAFDAIRIGTSYADVTPAVSDFQEDGDVDAADLGLWKTGFGLGGRATHMQGDADGDSDADGRDFLVWQRQLGYVAPTAGLNAAVPEPASLALVCVSGVLVLSGVRRRVLR
jgi:hypothetical protein